LIPRDSRWEIELRAHCLYATALMTDEINKLRRKSANHHPASRCPALTHYHTTTWPHHFDADDHVLSSRPDFSVLITRKELFHEIIGTNFRCHDDNSGLLDQPQRTVKKKSHH